MKYVTEKGLTVELSKIKDVNSLHSYFSDQQADVSNLISDAYNALWNDRIDLATTLINRARIQDVENAEAKCAEILLVRWKKLIREAVARYSPNAHEKIADSIVEGWYDFIEEFQSLPDTVKKISKTGRDVFQRYFIGIAKAYYLEKLKQEPQKKNTLSFRFKLFHCYKLRLEYERAIEILTASLSLASKAQEAHIYAHLADCFHAIGNEFQARVFFKHAFFSNPTGIILREIQSNIISDILYVISREHRYVEQYYSEWIPVYGYVIREFDICRKLSPIEVENLKQEVNSYEVRLRDPNMLGRDDPALLLPRLLTKLFTLLDHYQLFSDTAGIREEIRSKIREYDAHIFNKLEESGKKTKVEEIL